MLTNTFLAAAMLAGQFAAGAYLPIVARHDEAESLDSIITVTHAIPVTAFVTPTSTKSTKTLTRTSTAYVYETSSAQDAIDAGLNPINGLPVPKPSKSEAAKSTKSMCGPSNYRFECPNSTAIPSAFKTKPLTTLETKATATPTSSKPEVISIKPITTSSKLEPIVIQPLTETTINGKPTYVPVPLNN